MTNQIQAANPLPGIAYDMQCRVLTRFPFNQLIQFIKKHPDLSVWKERYTILRDVYIRKESIDLIELTALKKILSFNPTGRTKSWVDFLNTSGLELEKLKHLDLSPSQYPLYELTNEDLMAILKLCPNLTSINLNSTKIQDAAIANIAKLCPNLTSINLNNCYKISDAAILALTQYCPNLESINLCGSAVTDAAILALAQNCPKLSSIDLSHCSKITDAAVRKLTSTAPLTSLGLEGTHRKNIAVQPCPHLTSFRLHEIRDAETFASDFPNLTKVWVEKITDDGVKALCAHCPNLTSFGTQNISDAGIEMLAKQYPNLTRVDLPYCKEISNASVQSLAKYCPKLSRINLQGNPQINDQAFSQTQFPNLTSIFLAETRISESTVQKLLQNSPNLTEGNYGQGRYIKSIQKN